MWERRKGYGSATPVTQLRRGLTPISKFPPKKCTANLSAFRIRTKQSLFPGSRAVRSFDRAAAGNGEMERYSTSDPATNPFRPIINKKSRRLCETQFDGRHPKALAGSTQFRTSKFPRNVSASAKISRVRFSRYERLDPATGEIAS